MSAFWPRLRERKLVQWALAYGAGAFALLQGVDIVAAKFAWPGAVERGLIIALCVGFFVALVLAWYHGERGAQRVSGTELAILALLLLIGGGLLWRLASTAPPPAAPASLDADAEIAAPAPASAAAAITSKSIAVLPFESLSEDPANRYFADGLQDLILTKLADIGDLKVISRTSTAKYASRPDDLKVIARQLGVAHVVEGSVQKAGNEVMINVQLIDARGDRHVWATTYQRTLDNIFGVEGEVAQKIADALKARLTPSQAQAVAAAPTHDAQAFDDYLRARQLVKELDGGDAAKLPLAIAAFQRAIERDPGFALAWADLANLRASVRYSGLDRSVENLAALEREATRALALAPDLADAHLAMSGVQRFVHHDYAAMRREARRAIELRPNFADAYLVLGISEWHLGRHEADRAAMAKAAALSPGDADIAFSTGVLSTGLREYDQARGWFERVLAIEPRNARAYAWLAELQLLQHGDVAAAQRALDAMAPGTPESFGIAGLRVRLLSYRRDFAAARIAAARLAERFADRPFDVASHRGEVEWLAGERGAAAPYYRAVVGSLTTPAADLGQGEHETLAVAFARLGDSVRAEAELRAAQALFEESTRRSDDNQSLDTSNARVQLALGKREAAIDALARALALPSSGFYVSVAMLRTDPTWDALRADPRFRALLKDPRQPASARASAGDARLKTLAEGADEVF